MPYATNGGVKIWYEETGEGTPIVFLHEFLGNHESWRDQMRHFGRGYRCVTIAARGFPPSDAPEDESAYSQDIFTADALAVIDHLKIGKAHLMGLSMGAYTALQIALKRPKLVLSVVSASGASGGNKATREGFEVETRAVAKQLEKLSEMPAEGMASGPTRVHVKRKDHIAWQGNVDDLTKRSPQVAAMTLRQVQVGRAPVYSFEKELRAMTTPVLLLVGDEDESCLDVNLYLKRAMPTAQLVVMPGCGHVLNLEEPALFNQLTERFITSVDRGVWYPRDPSTMPGKGGATAVGLGSSPKA
ncbi:MAG: alpha/beta hydrolase [Pseudomonadota bacterium]|nr:alpha/beta hydrolase [Pseudomonadota bacterium]